jgi:nucleoporin NDC1
VLLVILITVLQTTPLSTFSPDHNTTLVSGVASSDRIFKFFAYVELRDLAKDQTSAAEARRTALFADQKYSPNLWTFLTRESLLLLEHDYQLFLRRGQPLPPTVDPVPSKVVFQPTSLIATPAPLLRQKIFRSIQESPVQAALNVLGADGPIAKAVEAGAEATHVPELFRSVEARVLSTPVVKEVKKNVDSRKTVGSLKRELTSITATYARRYTPELLKEGCRQMIDWWERERMSKVVQASLPFRELDVVVVEGNSFYCNLFFH